MRKARVCLLPSLKPQQVALLLEWHSHPVTVSLFKHIPRKKEELVDRLVRLRKTSSEHVDILSEIAVLQELLSTLKCGAFIAEQQPTNNTNA